jgi:diguanylate cyclase (GGDEF)-like protein
MQVLSWFDNRTLVSCDLLVAVIFAVVFFSTRRGYPNLRGATSIGLSFLLGVPGTFLLASHGSMSQLVSVMLANSCVFGSFIFLYRGILRFLGSRQSMIFPCVVSSAALAVLYSVSQVQDSIIGRIVAFSITVGVIRGLIAFELFRKSPTFSDPKAMRLFAAAMSFFAAVNVNFGIISMANRNKSSLATHALGSVTLLVGLVSICVTGLFVMIVYNSDLLSHSKDDAQKDALCGALNRRGIEAKLAAELKHIARGQQKLTIALIDIDHFKAINDIKGHAAGDAALRDVTAAIGTRLRGRDFLGRYGGDEFLLILPQTGATIAELVAERLSQAVRELSLAGRRQNITLSIGLTEAVPDDDAITLIARADKALYQAKSEGRDCWRFLRADDAERVQEPAKSKSLTNMLMPTLESTLAQRQSSAP